jgi:hypothetical protein
VVSGWTRPPSGGDRIDLGRPVGDQFALRQKVFGVRAQFDDDSGHNSSLASLRLCFHLLHRLKSPGPGRVRRSGWSSEPKAQAAEGLFHQFV